MAKERDPVFHLRLPHELKEQLESAAKEGHRSINSEILLRLQQSFNATGPGTGGDVEYRLRAIEQQLGLFELKPARKKR